MQRMVITSLKSEEDKARLQAEDQLVIYVSH